MKRLWKNPTHSEEHYNNYSEGSWNTKSNALENPQQDIDEAGREGGETQDEESDERDESEEREMGGASFGVGFLVVAFTTWWQSRTFSQQCITWCISILISRLLHRGLGNCGNLPRSLDSLYHSRCLAGDDDNYPNSFRLRTFGLNLFYIITKQ